MRETENGFIDGWGEIVEGHRDWCLIGTGLVIEGRAG